MLNYAEIEFYLEGISQYQPGRQEFLYFLV